MKYDDIVIKVFRPRAVVPYHEELGWNLKRWWNRENAIDSCLSRLGILRQNGLSCDDRIEAFEAASTEGDPVYIFKVVVAYAGQLGLIPVYTRKTVGKINP